MPTFEDQKTSPFTTCAVLDRTRRCEVVKVVIVRLEGAAGAVVEGAEGAVDDKA